MVSAIIPVYNAESFLERCFESVLGQSYGELEVILVNDGSTDGSGSRCDAFASRDTRVRVIHQDNRGVSAARNAGLEQATGEYVFFVDADDFLEPNAVQVLTEAMDSYEVELVVGSHYATRIGKDHSVRESSAIRIAKCGIKERDNWFRIHYDDAGPCSKDEVSRVWGKLFMVEPIRRNGVRFREELLWLEDITFCLEYATTMKQAVSLPDLICHHCHFDRGAHTTLTRRVFRNEFENIDRAYVILREVYEANKLGDQAWQCLDGFYARNVIGCFIRMFSADSPLTHEEALAKARDIFETPRVQKSLATYRAAAGSSRLIPFLLRRGMIRAAARFAKRRA